MRHSSFKMQHFNVKSFCNATFNLFTSCEVVHGKQTLFILCEVVHFMRTCLFSARFFISCELVYFVRCFFFSVGFCRGSRVKGRVGRVKTGDENVS